MATSLYMLVLSCSKVVEGGYKFVQALLFVTCLEIKCFLFVTCCTDMDASCLLHVVRIWMLPVCYMLYRYRCFLLYRSKCFLSVLCCTNLKI